MMPIQPAIGYIPGPLEIGLLAAMFLLMLTAVWFLSTPFRRVTRFVRHADSMSGSDTAEVPEVLPGVSIVVHSFGDPDVLSGFLEEVLRQDYPDFEIIVVNDASGAATAMLAEKFAGNDKIYFTFIPPGSRSLSRNKLALTIGIKGAKKEVILTTTDYARPLSVNWLHTMATPLAMSGKCGAVLGTATPDFRAFPRRDRLWARFFYAVRTARWVNAAIIGRPWRGNGFNLAFRRQLFFDNKGYSRYILLEGGDDDLFIETISANNAVSVAPGRDARVVMEWGNATKRLCRNILRRRRETEKELNHRSPAYMRRLQICNLLMLLIGAATITLQPIVTVIAAVALMLLIAVIVEWITLHKLTLSLTDNRRSESPESGSPEP